MSKSVQPERSSDRAAETEPSMAELLDPAALERKLREARERRVEAIRAREERAAALATAGDGPDVARVPPRPGPRPVALPADGPEIPNRLPRPEWMAPPAAPERSAPPTRGLPPIARPGLEPAEDAGASAPRPAWGRPAAAENRSVPVAPPAEPARDADEPAAAPMRRTWEAPTPPEPASPNPTPTPRPEPTELVAPARYVAVDPPEPIETWTQERSRRVNGLPALLLAIFLIGLIGGGAAVLFAPPSFRARIAQAIAPPASAPDKTAADESASDLPAPGLAAPDTEARAPEPESTPAPEAPGTGTAAITARPVPAPSATAPEEEPARDEAAVTAGAPPEAMADSPGAPRAGAEEEAPAPKLSAPGDGETGTLASAAPLGELAAPDARAAIGPLRLPELAPDQAADEAAATPPVPEAPQALRPAMPRAATETPPADPSAPEPEAPAGQVSAPVAPPAATPPDEATLAQARVSVHYPPSAAGTANELAAALRDAGAGTAAVLPAGFSVSSTNVRYYHPEDRAAALAVAALASGAGPVETRDFTNFRPQPLPGVVEIWLRGTGSSGGGVAARSPAPVTAAPRAQAQPQTRGRDLEAEAVERMLLSREVERMLRQQGGAGQ
ncbi:hypothetical protein [Amaricoccus solimangrovi]|uniref:Uncharacterized protein n=1 Tax=Amaricoccus solimangrovi TaxID=2589815 RepID=A0A501WK77_9RHOB|nr:hypothetical protein [Amaricoccus solimangrovi]TPE48845.1 hypothetical protein FJM51_16685 [Amaricoccus solimangrovi]